MRLMTTSMIAVIVQVAERRAAGRVPNGEERSRVGDQAKPAMASVAPDLEHVGRSHRRGRAAPDCRRRAR